MKTPQPADVIRYAYLWAREADAGGEEGLKDRPVVVVLATEFVEGQLTVLAAPVTSQRPADPATAIPIPPRVMAHLKLDASASWIMLTEVNRFVWPGPDIRPFERGGERTVTYGQLPEALYNRVRDGIVARWRNRAMREVER